MAAVCLTGAALPVSVVYADLSSCGGDTTPHVISTNSTSSIQFTVQNTDANDIKWMRVLVPTSDYVIVSTSISGWDDTTAPGSTSVYLTNGTLASGDSIVFTIDTQAPNYEVSSANWTILASDQPTGDFAIGCTGAQDLATTGSSQQPLTISNLHVTGIGTTSATVNWDTNEAATSRVDYGLDSGYGSQAGPDTSLATSHSMALNNLTPNTIYHFQAYSETSGGAESTTSGDSTFVTADVTVVQQETGGGGGGGVVTTPTGQPTETTPPTIAWTSTVAPVYKAAPTLTGTASDNEAVAKVEYSIDGGKNWSAVDQMAFATVTTGKGKKKKTTADAHSVTWSFTPVLIEDGNYSVLARATDPSGNTAVTPAVTVVLDRLPPRFGGAVLAFGSQVARTDAAGRWQTVMGLDQRLTLNAVGGPVQVAVEVRPTGQTKVMQTFQMQQNAGTGLWSGVASMQASGTYDLVVSATDGAGNHAEQHLPGVVVSAPARVVDAAKGNGPVAGAKVTLYYLQPQSGQWVVWDGAPFGQDNPQKVDDSGAFQLLVPAGTYYLRAEARGYQTIVTKQFSVDRPTPLVPVLKVAHSPGFSIGSWRLSLPWPTWSAASVQVAASVTASQNALEGKPLPVFRLPNTAGATVQTVGLLGKPTVLTVLSTWAPGTSEQLGVLDTLYQNPNVNVVPLMLGERMGRVQAFVARGDYAVPVLVDADASLSDALGVPGPPVHYFLDRRGKVTRVVTGILSADELLQQLAKH